MKLKNIVFAGLLGALFFFSGCGDEGDTIIQGGNAYVFSDKVTVDINEWKWNEDEGRFEYTVPYKDLTGDVYKYGVVIAHLYTQDNGKEVLKNLPFEKEYWDESVEPNLLYSERISFDIQLGSLTFFIENSDKIEREDFLETYAFKVVVIWDGVES